MLLITIVSTWNLSISNVHNSKFIPSHVYTFIFAFDHSPNKFGTNCHHLKHINLSSYYLFKCQWSNCQLNIISLYFDIRIISHRSAAVEFSVRLSSTSSNRCAFRAAAPRWPKGYPQLQQLHSTINDLYLETETIQKYQSIIHSSIILITWCVSYFIKLNLSITSL